MTKPGQHLAELYRRWGRRVFEAHGILFTNVDPGSRVFTPVADHGDYHLTAAQAAAVLREGRGWILRYPSLTDPGLEGGAYVCVDPAYSLGHLTKRMRNYVRRGQEVCEIRMLDAATLIQHGLRLNQDTDARHGRRRPEFCDPARWAATAEAACSCPGAFAIGAWVGGELASYEIGVLDGEWAYAVIQMSRTDMLEHYPNHTLDFAFNQWAFSQPGIRGVSIGPVALRANEGLHNYKIRMGFTVQRRHVAIRLHPAVRLAAANRAMGALVAAARRWGGVAAGPLEGWELVIKGSRITARQAATTEFGTMTEPERETI